MEVDVTHFKDARRMAEVEDESVALVVTSPPYWNVKDYSKDGHQERQVSQQIRGQIGDLGSYESYLRALTKVWKECERVLEPNGKLCINAPLMPILKRDLSTHHTRDIVNIAASIEHEILTRTGLYLMDVYVWNRSNATKKLMFGSYPYPPNFYAQNFVEFVTVYVKDGPPRRRSKAARAASKLTEKQWVEFTSQVWNLTIPSRKHPAYGKHPALMPDAMAERLIRLYSFVGDVVLDPFIGSGTTACAAIKWGRHYIGYEVNKAYRPIIERRLAGIVETRQLALPLEAEA